MSSRTHGGGLSLGDLLSGLGAAVLLVTLWRPWYELRFPDEVLNQARQFAGRMGDLAPFAQQGVDQLRSQGPVPISAWQAFHGADTALAVAAALVLGLALLNAIGVLASRVDGLVILAGVAAAGIVAYHLADVPGSGSPFASQVLHTAAAPKVALAAAALIAVGGFVGMTGSAAPRHGAPAEPATPVPTTAHDVTVYDAS